MDLRIKIFTSYREAFNIRQGEIISLVGGGGKTTLMFSIARELSSGEGLVVTTTTTRITEPLSSQTEDLYVSDNDDDIINWLEHKTGNFHHVTVARKSLNSGKLRGIDPMLTARISSLNAVSAIIVEADGASRKPLKAPNATEPVIPENTSLVIPVVGIDALNRPLSQDAVFRPEIAASLLDMSIGDTITAESIATLITHESGLAKGSPSRARIIPFVNKVDTDSLIQESIRIAREILLKKCRQITRVVSGQALSQYPYFNVIYIE